MLFDLIQGQGHCHGGSTVMKAADEMADFKVLSPPSVCM